MTDKIQHKHHTRAITTKQQKKQHMKQKKRSKTSIIKYHHSRVTWCRVPPSGGRRPGTDTPASMSARGVMIIYSALMTRPRQVAAAGS